MDYERSDEPPQRGDTILLAMFGAAVLFGPFALWIVHAGRTEAASTEAPLPAPDDQDSVALPWAFGSLAAVALGVALTLVLVLREVPRRPRVARHPGPPPWRLVR